ncbi:hypothetical protein [Bdellovibrio sp. BCCA]|uniref:hypothetical protein n=1 Tax=Bdellovibrio sp. BCCA TaxID=3136281 RepID=UPI0030EFBDCB
MAPLKANAFDLGPFEVSVGLCRDTKKIGSYLNAFQFGMWPVAGLPAIVTGMSMRTSPIVDSCNYIIQLSQADTLTAINMGADLLNEITEKKHDRAFEFSKQVMKLSNSYFDLRTGKRREGSLSMHDNAARIGNFMTKYGRMKKRWDKEDADIAEREEQQRMIQTLATSAKDRAIIADMISCPDTKDNPDYDQIYKENYAPLVLEAPTLKQDYDFAKGQLERLAAMAFATGAEYRAFLKVVNTALIEGIRYEQRQVSTSKKTNKVKTGDKDAEGNAVTKDEVIEKPVYEYRVVDESSAKFGRIRSYRSSYKSWVSNHWRLETNRGKTPEQISAQFVKVSPDCSPYALAQGLDPNDKDSEAEYERRKLMCYEGKKFTQQEAKNLFENTIEYLRLSTVRYKTNLAKQWTLDSKHRGINRAITVAEKDEYKQEKVACSAELQMAEMQYLSLQQEQVNVQYNEIIAQELVKQNTIVEQREAQAQENKKVADQAVNDSIRKNDEYTASGISFPKPDSGKKNDE